LPAAAAAGSLRPAAAVYRARHAEQPLGAYDAGGPGSRACAAAGRPKACPAWRRRGCGGGVCRRHGC